MAAETSSQNSGDSENDWDAFKARLEYHKHLFDRVKLQEEVRDRWFNYYLLIMASTVTIMDFALKEMGSASQIPFQVFLSLLGIFLGIVGVIFFQIHLNQRHNYMVFLRRMELLEHNFFYPKLVDPELVSRMKKPLPRNPGGGADKNVQTLFLCTNSLVLAISGFTFGQTINISSTALVFLSVVAFAASAVYHLWRMATLSRALARSPD
jgi:hypothetical protein